jgi:asparagine synthase (glutamine-hydrolysing)
MCGIGAVINHENAYQLLKISLGKILYRGTKQFEMEKGNGYALGTNRLPIVDRKNARQPCRSEDGHLLCVFNGEIFNYRSLRTRLEAAGHQFVTDGDTEILVHLYEEHGEHMLALLDSEMFSFLIYDKSDGSFFAARDPIGVKPLYWAQSNGSVYFASEMKQLAQFDEICEILSIPPGHYVKNGALSMYSDIRKSQTQLSEAPEKIAAELRRLIHEAVRKRVQTDLPIAVFLSGGVDSTSILAIARRYPPDVTAIIAGSEDSLDRYYAEKYCLDNSIPYRIVPLSDTMLEENLESTITTAESYEPNVVRNSAISYQISKAAQDFRVVLCGEGADELFFGYREFELASAKEMNDLGIQFLSDLHRTQCQRVDRTSMLFAQEVRIPFLDRKVVEYAKRIPAQFKVRNGQVKWILRKAMEMELPYYICWRPKSVLSEGSGFKGNSLCEGLFDNLIEREISDGDLVNIRSRNPNWRIRTKEEALYFSIFKKAGYYKCGFAQRRPKTNKKRENPNLFDILKSRRYNRHAPYKLENVPQQDIKFVMFWGYLGKRRPDHREHDAIRILSDLKYKVEGASRRAIRAKIILADRHAKLNGFDEHETKQYFDQVGDLFGEYGFETVSLDLLWKKWYLEDSQIHRMAPSIQICNAELEHSLVRASDRYFQGKEGQGHQIYYAMRKLERPLLKKEFEGSIFLTYNGPKFREILPDMPTLHLRPRKNSSEPPWLPAKTSFSMCYEP